MEAELGGKEGWWEWGHLPRKGNSDGHVKEYEWHNKARKEQGSDVGEKQKMRLGRKVRLCKLC